MKKTSLESSTGDLYSMNELAYGHYLAKLFLKEWDLSTREDTIRNLEAEHNTSLALLIENEAQKMELEDLNKKLTKAALIAEKDLRMASNVQKSLLFQSPPDNVNFDIAFHYQPLAGVSGDFYDFYTNNNMLTGVLLSDVSGHGIASSLITAIAKPIFFRMFRKNQDHDLGSVMDIINESLIREIGASDNYLTAVLLRFNKNIVEYVNAAHPDIIKFNERQHTAYKIRPGNSIIQGTMLGLSYLIQPYESFSFEIIEDDVIVLFTDGMTESTDIHGNQFTIENVIKSLLDLPKGLNAKDILDELMEALKKHIGQNLIRDDLTIIILKKK